MTNLYYLNWNCFFICLHFSIINQDLDINFYLQAKGWQRYVLALAELTQCLNDLIWWFVFTSLIIPTLEQCLDLSVYLMTRFIYISHCNHFFFKSNFSPLHFLIYLKTDSHSKAIVLWCHHLFATNFYLGFLESPIEFIIFNLFDLGLSLRWFARLDLYEEGTAQFGFSRDLKASWVDRATNQIYWLVNSIDVIKID